MPQKWSEARFRIRYLPGVDETFSLIWRNERFKIEEVLEADARRTELILMAHRDS